MYLNINNNITLEHRDRYLERPGKLSFESVYEEKSPKDIGFMWFTSEKVLKDFIRIYDKPLPKDKIKQLKKEKFLLGALNFTHPTNMIFTLEYD